MGVKNSFLGKLLGAADKFSDEQVLQTISLLVEHGVKHGATDIHIEPQSRFVLVRYRIDARLRAVHKLPTSALPSILRQVKSLAHLNESEEHAPQEGQYSALVGDQQFEILVSTLPVIGGEKVVLHIAHHLTRPPSLNMIGFWGPGLQALSSALARTHGLLIVSSPRRNGQTTTLHSMLQMLNTPIVSIATVESAIEYRVSGASQTRVRPQRGITFHEGLQAALNQDPNIILVSSVPDRQTANQVVQAAASGHVVLAGLHADSAAGALSHMYALSGEPFLLATAVQTVVGQRLVRRLCIHCRERYIPSQEQLSEIEKTFGISNPASHRHIHELEQRAASEGIDNNNHVNTTPSHITSLWRASDDGCENCDHTGYQGALAIVEVLQISDSLQKTLLGHASAAVLHKQALKEGFVPMGLDGLVKALRGQTTIPEILRTMTSLAT